MEQKQLNKLMKKFKFLKKKTLPSGIECGNGWNNILTELFQEIADSNPPSDFVVIRVFSKLDELRVHTKGGNNTTRFAIDNAVEKSSEICEECGNNKDLQQCNKCNDGPPVVENDIEAILHPDAAALAAAASAATSCSCGSNPCTCDTNISTTTATSSSSCGGGCTSGACPSNPTNFIASSNLADYFFKVEFDPNMTPPDYFIITPQAYWNTFNCLYDRYLPIDPALQAAGFYEIQESFFEYANGDKIAGRNALLKLGLIENNNM